MKILFISIVILISTVCQAGIYDVKVSFDKIDGGYNVLVDNNEYCPVSVKIDFELQNLTVEGGNNNIYVVEARKKGQIVTTLKISKKNKAVNATYTLSTNHGDHYKKGHDKDYIYDLPFMKNNKFFIGQGYNGAFSHKNMNALDFQFPIGTEITAIREGIVVRVIQENNKHCTHSPDCKKYNNTIIVYHSDGTFADYAHIKQNGSIVKIGDQVKKGQVIGYSGDVGYAQGPHLHIAVFNQRLTFRENFKTKFRIGNGDKAIFLNEKTEYSREY